MPSRSPSSVLAAGFQALRRPQRSYGICSQQGGVPGLQTLEIDSTWTNSTILIKAGLARSVDTSISMYALVLTSMQAIHPRGSLPERRRLHFRPQLLQHQRHGSKCSFFIRIFVEAIQAEFYRQWTLKADSPSR
jgi:hypothetical protein